MFWAVPRATGGCGRACGRTIATGDDALRWNFLRTLAPLALAANLRGRCNHRLPSNLLACLILHHPNHRAMPGLCRLVSAYCLMYDYLSVAEMSKDAAITHPLERWASHAAVICGMNNDLNYKDASRLGPAVRDIR